jgi:hypothetical protein
MKIQQVIQLILMITIAALIGFVISLFNAAAGIIIGLGVLIALLFYSIT